MKLTGYKRIIKEGVPKEYHVLIDAIAPSINDFADQVINAFNKNITVEDNLNMEIKTLEVVVDGGGIPTMSTAFKSNLADRVRGIVVIRAENLTNSMVYPTAAPFITYSENNSVITINHIAGLPASDKFKLRLETRS